MEKELKIEVPDGYEIDKQKSTFEKIVFKKVNPLYELPEGWEEYCEQHHVQETDWFIADNCRIIPLERKRVRKPYTDINVMPKEHCEAFLAYMKLFQLRNAWVKDCDDANMNYRIMTSDGKIDILCCYIPKTGLSFPTQEMADEFADVFKDLLETAKPLL